jgi:hypothetical protein
MMKRSRFDATRSLFRPITRRTCTSCSSRWKKRLLDGWRRQRTTAPGPVMASNRRTRNQFSRSLDALLELHRTPASARKAVFKELRARLAEELAEEKPFDAGSRRIYRRTLLRMADEAWMPSAKVGAYLRTLPWTGLSPMSQYIVRVSLVLLVVFWRAWLPPVATFFRHLRSVIGL